MTFRSSKLFFITCIALWIVIPQSDAKLLNEKQKSNRNEIYKLVPDITLNEGWAKPQVLPPPLNVSGGWLDSVQILPNGQSMVFGYSRYDFSSFISSGATKWIVTGKPLNGVQSEKFKIFRAQSFGNSWRTMPFPLNSDPEAHEASPGLNATQNLLFFTTWRYEERPDSEVFYSVKNGSKWSEPVSAPFNGPCDDDNPHPVNTTDGYILFFESKRTSADSTSCGSLRKLYYVTYNKSQGLSKVYKINGLGESGGSEDDTQPFVTPDLKQLYWTSIRDGMYGIFAADLDNEFNASNIRNITKVVATPPLKGKVVLLGEPTLAKNQREEILFFVCGFAIEDNKAFFAANVASELKVCRATRPISRRIPK